MQLEKWIRALFKSAEQKRVERILARHCGGIYKRIDENRELFELLQAEAPEFLVKHFWVAGWLDSADVFLTDIAEAMPVDGYQFQARLLGDFPFPRQRSELFGQRVLVPVKQMRVDLLSEPMPSFDADGDPTEETLSTIENWQADYSHVADPWGKFIDFCREAWNMVYGTIRKEHDEDGNILLCFVTGGCSSNEAVQGAMNKNLMFRLVCWHSSYRGGMVKYSVGAVHE